jgi:hypothetical protein
MSLAHCIPLDMSMQCCCIIRCLLWKWRAVMTEPGCCRPRETVGNAKRLSMAHGMQQLRRHAGFELGSWPRRQRRFLEIECAHIHDGGTSPITCCLYVSCRQDCISTRRLRHAAECTHMSDTLFSH